MGTRPWLELMDERLDKNTFIWVLIAMVLVLSKVRMSTTYARD